MTKTTRDILIRLSWLWQLPQQVLGYIYALIMDCAPQTTTIRHDDGRVIHYSSWQRGGITLGSHIFIPYYYLNLKQGAARVHHESGHYVQSLLLGPLYLLVVGLPSLTWSALRLIKRIKEAHSYYWFYTEAWAMRLADRFYAGPIKS